VDVVMVAALLLPAIPIGVLLGKKINQLLSDKQFYFALHVVLGITGTKLLIDVFG
jgi:uncharacterized membrane protein YfcA